MQNEISTEWPIEKEYGVCRLSVVNIYQEPSPTSGLLSQLLFGETYKVIGKSSCCKWVKISVTKESVEGWLVLLQHQEITMEEFFDFNDPDFQITTSPISTIVFKGAVIYLLAGSHLHVSRNELFDIGESIRFVGQCRSNAVKATRDEIVNIAYSFLNVPYQSGGKNFFGIGVGAFIHLVFKIGGYHSPQFLSQILERGEKVSADQARKGDLLIFVNEKQIPDHVGIYLGYGEMIHVNGKVTRNHVNFANSRNEKNISTFWHVHEIRNIM